MAVSRYKNTVILNEEGQPRHMATVQFPSKKKLDAIPTFKIRVSQHDRLDQLAYKYLGDGTYWWVLALINDIDWAYDFDAGSILKIPISLDDVLKLV